MNKSEKLKSIILSRYKSIREFSFAVGIPNTTLVSALDRGIGGMAIDKVIQICDFLNLDIKTFEPLENEISITHINNEQKNLLDRYSLLDEQGKNTVNFIIDNEIKRINAISEINISNKKEITHNNDEIEKELGAYRLELEAELKGKTSSVSEDIKKKKGY